MHYERVEFVLQDARAKSACILSMRDRRAIIHTLNEYGMQTQSEHVIYHDSMSEAYYANLQHILFLHNKRIECRGVDGDVVWSNKGRRQNSSGLIRVGDRHAVYSVLDYETVLVDAVSGEQRVLRPDHWRKEASPNCDYFILQKHHHEAMRFVVHDAFGNPVYESQAHRYIRSFDYDGRYLAIALIGGQFFLIDCATNKQLWCSQGREEAHGYVALLGNEVACCSALSQGDEKLPSIRVVKFDFNGAKTSSVLEFEDYMSVANAFVWNRTACAGTSTFVDLKEWRLAKWRELDSLLCELAAR